MNVYDSARMADVMAPHGYRRTDSAEDADLIVLNTCHIREKAAEKVYSELGRLRRRKRPGAVVAVAGCVAQAEGAEVTRRAPCVDIVLGPQTYHRLPEMVARLRRGGGPVIDTDFPVEPKFDSLPEEAAPRGSSAYLTAQEGCDKFCSFCVVPYTRGAEYSRPAADVIAEARRLAAGGAREITLLGQNVNAYHGPAPDGASEWRLARLLRALAGIDGVDRLRYTTSHPMDMTPDLIAAHGELPQLMPYLHLPAQSGSDRVLAAMNRRHRVGDYLRVVEALRRARPDIALSSDFIVGHPGETAADFAETLRLVRDLGYAQAYSFRFSARPGTPAAARGDPVPEEAARDRLGELQALLDESRLAFNRRSVGAVLPVLFDREGARPDQRAGRSPYMQAVHAAHAPAGTIADVLIDAAHAHSLSGRVRPEGAVA